MLRIRLCQIRILIDTLLILKHVLACKGFQVQFEVVFVSNISENTHVCRNFNFLKILYLSLQIFK